MKRRPFTPARLAGIRRGFAEQALLREAQALDEEWYAICMEPLTPASGRGSAVPGVGPAAFVLPATLEASETAPRRCPIESWPEGAQNKRGTRRATGSLTGQRVGNSLYAGPQGRAPRLTQLPVARLRESGPRGFEPSFKTFLGRSLPGAGQSQRLCSTSCALPSLPHRKLRQVAVFSSR